MKMLSRLLVLFAMAVADANDSFHLFVNNPSDSDVKLMWVSPEGKEHLINDIAAAGEIRVNTFHGHTFGWRKVGTSDRLSEFVVNSQMAETHYTLPGMGSIPKSTINKSAAKRRVAKGDSKGIGGLSFRNLAERPLVMYWKNPDNGDLKFQGNVGSGEQSGFQTYEGHRFIWAEVGNEQNPTVVSEFVIEAGRMIYAYTDETTPSHFLDKLNEELAFRDQYLEDNGYDWIGTTWPRPSPTLWMHRPTHIGEIIKIPMKDSMAKQYTCNRGEDEEISACLGYNGKSLAYMRTAQDGPEELEIEVMSVTPRVFRIRNFVSDFEADFIIQAAKPQLRRSTTGHGKNTRVDNVRTSKSAWLTRSHGDVMDAVYRRIGLATNIPQELIAESEIAENLNVLNYPVGGEYTPHYDVGADGTIKSRFISGLLYLNTPPKGGGTSFPKAVKEDGTEGIYIDAVKGSLVFFYDLLEDGNVDVRSLHSGTKVLEGEKWVSPLWLWEPSRSGSPHRFGDLSRKGILAGTAKEL